MPDEYTASRSFRSIRKKNMPQVHLFVNFYVPEMLHIVVFRAKYCVQQRHCWIVRKHSLGLIYCDIFLDVAASPSLFRKIDALLLQPSVHFVGVAHKSRESTVRHFFYMHRHSMLDKIFENVVTNMVLMQYIFSSDDLHSCMIPNAVHASNAMPFPTKKLGFRRKGDSGQQVTGKQFFHCRAAKPV